MEKTSTEKKIAIPAMPKFLSSKLFAYGLGPVFLVIGLVAIYALQAYVAIVALIAFSAVLFWSASSHKSGSLEKTMLSSFAVAMILLMFALPGGELGYSSCPDKKIESQANPVKLLYFYSPFCVNCLLFDSNVEKAQEITGGFSVEYYDLRYCSYAAKDFGFYGTPCYAFLSPGKKVEKFCGALSSEDIANQVRAMSGPG